MVGGNLLLSKVGRSIFSSSSSVHQCCNWTPATRFNSTRAFICRINRLQYLRHYPTTVVNPDGSTYTIRYHEPRQIIKLPVDINVLSEAEREKHLVRRRPKTRVNLENEFEEDEEFDRSKYLKLVKK